MSLYNMLFGVNDLAPILLKILDIDQENNNWKSGRFRDIYLNETGDKIILYTRNGGGNRECWNLDKAPCDCTGCLMEKHIPTHPNYLYDEDDDFDSTYAYIYYSIPEKYKEFCQCLASGEKPDTISEKFQYFIRDLEKKK